MLKTNHPKAQTKQRLKMSNVTVANFARAETDHMIRANMKAFGKQIGQGVHLRQPTTPDNQPVIRMNQDTLYSLMQVEERNLS
jgi:hypothetical protein